jgi:hypothetical protein
MAITSTPATVLKVNAWTLLNISRSLGIVGDALTPAWTVNLTSGALEFLGDAQGNPTQALPQTMAMGAAPQFSNTSLDLSEVVTRADGSKLTVLELLDSIALVAATPVAS